MTRLEATNVCFQRKDDAFALRDISLSVGAGEILCVLGPNGAGKSTLILCLLGLLSPSSGGVRVMGEPIERLPREQIARRMAYVPQSTEAAFAYDVEQMVLFGRSVHFGKLGAPSARDRKIAHDALDKISVGHLRRRNFVALSGGERQLILIARALAQEAPIVILDEPTASLDLGNQRRVLEVIRDLARSGKSVVMTTHLPDQAFNLQCDVALMKQGAVIAQGPAKAACTLSAMNALYETELRLLKGDELPLLHGFSPRLR
jgi:iron complex transport system ATP-binding protein